jgi:uncharacterized protein (DUF1330 family)
MAKKGYWIGRVEVQDEEGYKAYVAANAEAFGKYQARFLVRGGPFEVVEGEARGRNVVIEFPDIETARACYHSPEYQRAAALRWPVAETDLIIIEGWED